MKARRAGVWAERSGPPPVGLGCGSPPAGGAALSCAAVVADRKDVGDEVETVPEQSSEGVPEQSSEGVPEQSSEGVPEVIVGSIGDALWRTPAPLPLR